MEQSISLKSGKRLSISNLVFLCPLVITSLAFITTLNAQWKQLDAGQPGEINAVTTIGADVFAGTMAGIYRSTDRGESWTNVSSVFAECFASEGSEIFAGTTNGVVRSTDGGNTWISPDTEMTSTVNAFAVKDSDIFAGGGGMFRSTDNGSSWTTIQNGMEGYQAWITGLAVDSTKLFATTYAGVMLSTDNGNSWTNIGGNGLSSEMTNCVAIYDSTVVVGTPGGMVRSTDDGFSWYTDNTGLPMVSGFYTPVLSFAVGEHRIFTGTSVGLYISSDSGASWYAANNGLPGNQVWSIAASDTILFAATNDGVFLSTNNGAIWTLTAVGIITSEVESIAGNGPDILAVMNSNSIFSSTDYGTSWTADTSLPSKAVVSVSVIGSNAYAITNNGVFLSSDNGQTWNPINGRIMDITYPAILVQSGSNLIVACQESSRVFLSSNDGITWTNVGTSLPEIVSLATSGSDVFAGTPDGMYVSTDSGESWAEINDTLININALAIGGSNIFAGRILWPSSLMSPPNPPGGVFRSTDNGQTWSSFMSGLPEYPQVLVLATHGSNIIAGLEPNNPSESLYSSTINGNNWINVGYGLPIGIISLFVNDSCIFVGTPRGGIWRAPLSQVTAIKRPIAPVLPNSFRLEQNYPNPFNPSTAIEYDIPQRSHVTLIIYDVLGRKVETLLDADQSPGHYESKFDASRLSSGVYFYRLRAGFFVQTKKLVVMK